MESGNDIKNDEDVSCELEETETGRCCCHEVEFCGCDFNPDECDVDTYCC